MNHNNVFLSTESVFAFSNKIYAKLHAQYWHTSQHFKIQNTYLGLPKEELYSVIMQSWWLCCLMSSPLRLKVQKHYNSALVFFSPITQIKECSLSVLFHKSVQNSLNLSIFFSSVWFWDTPLWHSKLLN